MINASVAELVDAPGLDSGGSHCGGSSPFTRTNFRRFIMDRKKTFENIYNKERFTVNGKPQSKYIDGIEYVKLCLEGTNREVFVRKDFLKKVNT